MIATFVNDDGTERKVWIRLTESERLAIKHAEYAAWFHPLSTPAELMGPELEAIVCGHAPERYVELKPWEEK